MKPTAYVSLIYGLIIILSGVMAYRFNASLTALFIEILAGIIITINVFFMLQNKRFSYYIVLFISLLLTIFYGYIFYQTNRFFPAILTAISFFVFITQLLKIVRRFGSE